MVPIYINPGIIKAFFRDIPITATKKDIPSVGSKLRRDYAGVSILFTLSLGMVFGMLYLGITILYGMNGYKVPFLAYAGILGYGILLLLNIIYVISAFSDKNTSKSLEKELSKYGGNEQIKIAELQSFKKLGKFGLLNCFLLIVVLFCLLAPYVLQLT